MPIRFFALFAAALFLAVSAHAFPETAHNKAKPESCVAPGFWRTPADATPQDYAPLLKSMATKAVVLLGEAHTSAEHHRWQLQTLAALHGYNDNLVIAFEMFPRSVQPVLDAWVRGDLDEASFLRKTRWGEVWRYDAAIYMPLFHFARMHRIPIVAMNVEPSLVKAVRKQGWDAVPETDREGVTTPEPALESYQERLFEIFLEHRKHQGKARGDDMPTRDSDAFRNFVAAQLTWDRAMAQKISEMRRLDGSPLVVGIVGSGHLEYGHGIPFQLDALGIAERDVAVLLPWDDDRDCKDVVFRDGTGVAHALFGVATDQEPARPERPLLGVMIETGDSGVRIDKVVEGSVADRTGLKVGDVIVKAAGLTVANTSELIDVIHRQAPGTWLPLEVLRDDEVKEFVARFPPKPVHP